MTVVGSATEEPDLDQPWEPWQPKVGDRVRVRLNGECHRRYHVMSLLGTHSDVRYGHVPEEDGRIGTVAIGPGRPSEPSHRFAVVYDVPMFSDGLPIVGGAYAAIELELIEAT